MLNHRLGWMGLGLVVAVAVQLGLSGWSPAAAQKQPAVQVIQFGAQPAIGKIGQDPDRDPTLSEDEDDVLDRVNLEKDKNADRKLKEAERLIQEKEWRQAIELLQSMLDETKDRFMKDDKGRWANVRSEANRLLGSLPAEGLQAYEQYYGAAAKKALREGLATSDPRALADVALRYKHTEAGAEATAHLGTYHLDNGRYVVAALCFQRLLEREGQLAKLPATTLLRAAIAFERKGDTARREQVWREFLRRNPGDLPPALRRLNQDQLLALVTAKFEGRFERERFDWPVFGGGPDRSARGEGGSPFLEKRYDFPLWRDPAVKAQLDQAVLRLATTNRPTISGYHPVAAGNLIIFRSYWGVHAVEVKTGEVVFDAMSQGGLDYLASPHVRNNDPNRLIQNTQATYQQSMPQMFFNNTMLGTLTTDNQRVYVIEDLALPPFNLYSGRVIGRPPVPVLPTDGGQPNWAVHNKLVAYDLQTGKALWDKGTAAPNQPFSETFFLGAPLVLGDKLYALGEVNGEIRLMCIEPQTGNLVYEQTLCFIDRRITEEAVRRSQACHLAFGDGILVCPTNAGVVLGVDLLTRSLVWARPYQSSADTGTFGKGVVVPSRSNNIGQGPAWLSSAPIIRDGRVVFTAPDGNWLYCLDVQNGRQLWKLEKNSNDLYLGGVFGNKVIIVGRETIRALDLQDGAVLWSRETGMPSGHGVASQTTYFLPLKAGEVWAINLEDGFVFGKSQSPKGEVPGNLIFHDGEVISQGVFHLTTYPQLQVREAEITRELNTNPTDPVALTKRGELRLHRGETLQAIADLRLALKHNPPPATLAKTRDKLYEGLSFLLERKFAEYEKDLPEFESLLTIAPLPNETPEQQQRRQAAELDRRALYLQLLARGRESQGRLKEAFHAYVAFARLGYTQLVVIPGEAGTKAPAAVWAQACIGNLFRRDLPAAVRNELEAAVRDEYEKLQASRDVTNLRRFVELFGPLCQEGGKAQLLLAERLIEAREFTEAQLKLLALESSPEELIRAQALEALARLQTRNGELRDAAFYYRLLAQRYPKVVLRDGKTGEELYMELATDKRFFAYLDDARRTWFARQEVRVDQQPGNFPHQQIFWLEPDGDVPPMFRRYRVGVFNHYTPMRAILYDRQTGSEIAAVNLEGLRPQINLYQQGHRFQPVFRAVGQLMVFHWGSHIHAVDPRAGKKIWSYNLLGPHYQNITADGRASGVHVQLIFNPNTGFELQHLHDNSRERVNFTSLVAPSIVCFNVKDEGLVAVDPLTGQRRWVKMDVPVGAELFGDGQHVFLISASRGDAAGLRGLAIRANDGMSVNVPNFGAEYGRKVALVQRCILLREPDRAGQPNAQLFRLYDPLTGKNRWVRPAGPLATSLSSYDPTLFGYVQQDGRVFVLHAESGKELVNGQIDPNLVAGNPEIHLLADDSYVYLAFNLPANANPQQGRTIQPFGLMMRNIPVHGPMFAFDRTSGTEVWKAELPPQQLILDQFADMPLVVCASWQRTFVQNAANPRFQDIHAILALDKRNGARVFDESTPMRQQFHTLNVDKVSGRVELLSYNYKIVFRLMDGAVVGQAPVAPRPPLVDPNPPVVRPPIVRPVPAPKPVPMPVPIQIDKERAEEELKRIIEEIKKDKEGLDRQKMEELRRIIEILEKKKQDEKNRRVQPQLLPVEKN